MPEKPNAGAPRIAVVGSLNMDLVVRTPRLPQPGETLAGGDFLTAHGGKGANQAVAAARQGGRVSLIGKVGADDFGNRLSRSLADEGIDTAHLTIAGRATGVAVIMLDTTGQNSIIISPGANGAVGPDDIDAAAPAIAEADVLLVQLEVPQDAVERAMVLARENKTRVVYNPSPYSDSCRALLPLADVLVPNEIEAADLSGIDTDTDGGPERAARRLLEQGPDTVLLTLGGRGVYAADRNGGRMQPGFAVEVKDTTAAGDTFVAAFAVATGLGLPLEAAVRRAQAAAALAVTRLGAQPSIPTAGEVDAFLKQRV